MPTVDAAAKAAATAELESLESKGLITPDGQQSRHGLRGIDNPVDQWVVDNMGAFEVNSQLYLFDLAAIVLFALVGRATHGESVLDPIGDAFTMLPFLAAYFVAAQPLGAYAADATESYRRAATCLAPAWAAGTLGGTALRAVGNLRCRPSALWSPTPSSSSSSSRRRARTPSTRRRASCRRTSCSVGKNCA